MGALAEAVREPAGAEATLVTLWTGVGLATGTAQAFVLRRRLGIAGWWIWASTVGWSFGLPLAALAERPGAWPILGLFTGALQWWVLRSEVRRAWVWIFVSAAGWSIAMEGGERAVEALRDRTVWLAIWPPVWALVSAMTGAAMVWLLRSTLPLEGGGLGRG